MDIYKTLRVNTPNVVHETIDGEAILLDLKSGNYFSLDGAGAIIWEFIEKTGNWNEAIDLMINSNEAQKDTISKTTRSFVEKLVKEQLLVEAKGDIKTIDVSELIQKLKSAAQDFTIPVVNKYSDMQDLLLLDPIHEVDEKGWPESKDIHP